MTRRELFAALIAPLVAVKVIAAPRKMSLLETQYRTGRLRWSPGFGFYDPPICMLCYDRGYIDTGRAPTHRGRIVGGLEFH